MSEVEDSDGITPKEVSDKIESVLAEVMTENNGYDEGDMLVDWVLIAYVTNPDESKDSAYPMFFSNGTMPGYKARGLLHTGLVYLDENVTSDTD